MADMLRGGIVINEVLVDPNGAADFDTDGDGTAEAGDEYVELYNVSDSPIDISGLELWDAGMGMWFVFPPGTILQPGAHVLVMADIGQTGSLPTGGPDDLFFDAAMDGAVINNTGDSIVVYDPSADEYIQATFSGVAASDPTDWDDFSETATQSGAGEDFGFHSEGQSLQRTPDGADSFADTAPTPGTTNICFAAGTRLNAPGGPRPVEELRPGDLLDTLDSGPRRIRLITSQSWTASEIAARPERAPVRIAAGALGPGVPVRPLRLSRHHRVLARGPIVARMFGTVEILIAAHRLSALPGIEIEWDAPGVSYYHVMMSRHELLVAEGLPSESLYLGAEVLKSLPHEARDALDDLLAVSGRGEILARPPRRARFFVEGRRARRLIERHVANGKPLVG